EYRVDPDHRPRDRVFNLELPPQGHHAEPDDRVRVDPGRYALRRGRWQPDAAGTLRIPVRRDVDRDRDDLLRGAHNPSSGWYAVQAMDGARGSPGRRAFQPGEE